MKSQYFLFINVSLFSYIREFKFHSMLSIQTYHHMKSTGYVTVDQFNQITADLLNQEEYLQQVQGHQLDLEDLGDQEDPAV